MGSDVPKSSRAQRQRGRDATSQTLSPVGRKTGATDHPFPFSRTRNLAEANLSVEKSGESTARDHRPGLGEAPTSICPPFAHSPARTDSWPWRLCRHTSPGGWDLLGSHPLLPRPGRGWLSSYWIYTPSILGAWVDGSDARGRWSGDSGGAGGAQDWLTVTSNLRCTGAVVPLFLALDGQTRVFSKKLGDEGRVCRGGHVLTRQRRTHDSGALLSSFQVSAEGRPRRLP